MRIRRTAIVLMMTLLAVPGLAGAAFAGGRAVVKMNPEAKLRMKSQRISDDAM